MIGPLPQTNTGRFQSGGADPSSQYLPHPHPILQYSQGWFYIAGYVPINTNSRFVKATQKPRKPLLSQKQAEKGLGNIQVAPTALLIPPLLFQKWVNALTLDVNGIIHYKYKIKNIICLPTAILNTKCIKTKNIHPIHIKNVLVYTAFTRMGYFITTYYMAQSGLSFKTVHRYFLRWSINMS